MSSSSSSVSSPSYQYEETSTSDSSHDVDSVVEIESESDIVVIDTTESEDEGYPRGRDVSYYASPIILGQHILGFGHSTVIIEGNLKCLSLVINGVILKVEEPLSQLLVTAVFMHRPKEKSGQLHQQKIGIVLDISSRRRRSWEQKLARSSKTQSVHSFPWRQLEGLGFLDNYLVFFVSSPVYDHLCTSVFCPCERPRITNPRITAIKRLIQDAFPNEVPTMDGVIACVYGCTNHTLFEINNDIFQLGVHSIVAWDATGLFSKSCISDLIITMFMFFICRSAKNTITSNTFFFPRIAALEEETITETELVRILNLETPLNLRKCERIFIPIHLPQRTHWVLGAIAPTGHHKHPHMFVLDSLRNRRQAERPIRKVLKALAQHVKPKSSRVYVPYVPQQGNETADCGIMILIYTALLVFGNSPPATSSDWSLWFVPEQTQIDAVREWMKSVIVDLTMIYAKLPTKPALWISKYPNKQSIIDHLVSPFLSEQPLPQHAHPSLPNRSLRPTRGRSVSAIIEPLDVPSDTTTPQSPSTSPTKRRIEDSIELPEMSVILSQYDDMTSIERSRTAHDAEISWKSEDDEEYNAFEVPPVKKKVRKSRRLTSRKNANTEK